MLLFKTVHLLSLIAWIGSILFFSLVGAPALFKSLPPEYAGKAVSAIFPKYFSLGIYAGLTALVSLIIVSIYDKQWPILKVVLLIFMIGLTVQNSLVTQPRARALKEEMTLATGKTDLQLLKTEFDRAHKWSVINNGTVLLLGIGLVVLTARRLSL